MVKKNKKIVVSIGNQGVNKKLPSKSHVQKELDELDRDWMEKIGNELITHIQDTGQGIPKEALPNIFTKFFRVSGILEQGSKGTGLGLYIAKSVIQLHKGKIWVNSEFGKGSTFSFSLPCTNT